MNNLVFINQYISCEKTGLNVELFHSSNKRAGNNFFGEKMKLTIIKWRDIPTQVMIKKSRREVEKAQLDNRFMEAVDEAAAVASATDADAYLADWNNEVIDIEDGDMVVPVAEKAAELEDAFNTATLQAYVDNGGNKP